MPATSNRASRAVVWASIETLLRQGLQFASGVVLARLLAPDDFGLVAMLVIFMALATLLADSGFASALIQQNGESDTDSSTAFWFSIAAGTVMAILLASFAPFIARFYERPELVPLTWAMAVNVWLSSWTSVHSALLARNLNFKAQAKAAGFANLLGALVAITLAVLGFGVWALVAQMLVTTLLNGIAIWHLYPWRPTATFSTTSFFRLFRFGGFMLAGSLLNAVATRFYALLIGKLYSSYDVGLYSRAVTTRDASQTVLGSIFSRVAFPILSRHGSDATAIRSRLKAGNQLTMAIHLPAMIGLCMVADVAVPTLFGPQWVGTVPILQVLCLAGALHPLQLANLQALMAQGHAGRMFGLGVVKSGVLALGMLIASQWGMLAIAWSTVFSALVSYFLNTYYSRKWLGYGAIKQIRDIGIYILLTAGMAAIVATTSHVLFWISPGKRLLLEVLAGAIFYSGAVLMLRLPAAGYAIELLRSVRPKRIDDNRA